MSELEVILREIDALPGPDEGAITAARAALRREIEVRPRPHRRRLLAGLGVAGFAAVAAGTLVLVFLSTRSPLGVRVAAAADTAFNGTNGEIVHATSRTRSVFRSKVGGKTITSQISDESWVSAGPPYARVDRYQYPGPTQALTVLNTSCGQISYDAARNLFAVSAGTEPASLFASDPAAGYRDAYRHGDVHFRGKVTFRGIPAYLLDVTQHGAVDRLIVRRDDYYPLETVSRREAARSIATYVTTYSTFEHLPRSASTAHLLRLTARPSAFYVRLTPAATRGSCTRFGSLQSLTGRNGSP